MCDLTVVFKGHHFKQNSQKHDFPKFSLKYFFMKAIWNICYKGQVLCFSLGAGMPEGELIWQVERIHESSAKKQKYLPVLNKGLHFFILDGTSNLYNLFCAWIIIIFSHYFGFQ